MRSCISQPKPYTMNRFLLFWLSAILLFCNDFIWKSSFHNAFTGKLSDIAGLSLWVLFWEAWLPMRFRLHLYLLSAVAFAWFKSPLSDTFLTVFHLGRVVDYTDLWALLVFVPLYFLPTTSFQTPKTWQPTLVGSVVALFLFGATSPPRHKPLVCEPKLVIGFKMPKDSLLKVAKYKLQGGSRIYKQKDGSTAVFWIISDSTFYQKYRTDFYTEASFMTIGKDSSTFTLDRTVFNGPIFKANDNEICSAIKDVMRRKLQAP
jgi:hypothetical protein